MARTVIKLAALAAALSFGETARAEPALPEGWLDAQVNEQGQKCEQRSVLKREAALLVACGAAGVWEVSVSDAGLRFVKSYQLSGEAVGFLTGADGAVWVQLRVLEARPLSAGAAGAVGAVRFPERPNQPESPPAPTAPAPTPAPQPSSPPPLAREAKAQGEVLRSRPGEVVVSLGSADGVARSDRIELSLQRRDDAWAEEELSRETLAVGVVTDVSLRSAKVRLGLNEQVPVGALAARSRAALTAGRVAPPRVGGVWELELIGRPFAALEELGGGILLSGGFGRRFAGNWRLRAVLDPLAVGDVDRTEAVTAVNAGVIGSYDSLYFEMGLGLGAQTVNESGLVVEPGSGLSVSQLLRLGAQDGLNIVARTSVVLFHSEFLFGGMVATGQIPVSRGYWLLLGGGGGNVGYGYGEFGLRVLLDGNGHAGSKFLTVTAGGAAVFRSATCDEFFVCGAPLTYGGPMAGVGGEWRF